MRAVISEKLRAYLWQVVGSTVLTVTLNPHRCCGGTLFEVSVDTHVPDDPRCYASFVQDGLCIYYSPPLGRKSDILELDHVRLVFRSKPILAGPEGLVGRVITGHL